MSDSQKHGHQGELHSKRVDIEFSGENVIMQTSLTTGAAFLAKCVDHTQ